MVFLYIVSCIDTFTVFKSTRENAVKFLARQIKTYYCDGSILQT